MFCAFFFPDIEMPFTGKENIEFSVVSTDSIKI